MASLLERLDEFGKRLDMSLARRSENEEMIRELEKELKEKCAIDSADVSSQKKIRWELDPLDFGRQEELDQLRYDLLMEELGADGEYG